MATSISLLQVPIAPFRVLLAVNHILLGTARSSLQELNTVVSAASPTLGFNVHVPTSILKPRFSLCFNR